MFLKYLDSRLRGNDGQDINQRFPGLGNNILRHRGGWSRLALLAMVITLFVSVVGVAQAEELLRNPGFEGASMNGIAPGWSDNSAWADVDVEYGLDADSVSGTSQFIDCRRVSSGAVQFVQHRVHLRKGKSYIVSVWIKGSVEGPVEIMLRKRGAPYTRYAHKAFRISNEWQRYEFHATSGVDDPHAMFMIRFTGQGKVWLDDASLREVAGRVVVPPKEGNLISNGSFEVGIDRWAVEVREAGGYRYEMSAAFADARPSIVSGDVPHGAYAMRVDIPRHARMTVTTPPFRISPGNRYTASLWLKADRPRVASVAMKDLGGGVQPVAGTRVKVSEKWRRYHFTTDIPITSGDQHILLIKSVGEGEVLLDGVQVHAGDNKNFSPSVPVEVGFMRTGSPPLYYQNEPLQLDVCLALHEPAGPAHTLQVTATNYHGDERELRSLELDSGKTGRHCLEVEHPSAETGYYRIDAKLSHASELVDHATMAIGIVPRTVANNHAASPFGGHARFNPASLKAMKMLGVSWLRMHPPLGTKWFVVEPEKGRFEFADEPIHYAKSLGFHILGSLDATPRWASSAPKDITSELAHGFPAYPPRNISDWEDYVSTVVRHYKGVIDHWEIWNEPDSGGFFKLPDLAGRKDKPEAYVRLVKSASIAAKDANPEAVIVVGAGSGLPPIRWIQQIVDYGVLDYADVLSFHYYTDGRPSDSHDTPARERVADVRKLMEAHGKDHLRLWESESGFPLKICTGDHGENSFEYCVAAEQAVGFVIRNYFEWIRSGVDRWFLYHMFFPDRTDRMQLAAFFEWDRSPTPLAVGYAVMSHMLSGMEYVESFDLNDDVAGITFANGERILTAYWVKQWTGDARHRVTIKADATSQGVMILDAMGVQVAQADPGTTIDVEIGRVPVYKVEFLAKEQDSSR